MHNNKGTKMAKTKINIALVTSSNNELTLSNVETALTMPNDTQPW